MRESMARLTPQFSANRAVREYTEKHYIAAAAAYQSRVTNSGAAGRQIVDWRRSLEEKWATLHIGTAKVETRGGQHLFEVGVCLNGLDHKAVRVELYADGVKGKVPFRQEMQHVEQLSSSPGCHAYSATVCAKRAAADYTVRVVPYHDGVAIPLEEHRILWQR
jgi:starch phosphorylase